MISLTNDNHSVVYFISGMWCSTCAKTVQEKVSKIVGVQSAEVSYPTKLLVVRLQETAQPAGVDEEVRVKIEGIGFGVRRQAKGWLTSFKQDLSNEQKRNISSLRISVVWFLAMWSSMIAATSYLGNGLSQSEQFYLSLASSTFGIPAILIAITSYAKSGLRALWSSRLLTLDLFIFIGGCAATAVSVMNLLAGRADTYADSAAMVVAVLLLSKKMENVLVAHLANAILYQINQADDSVDVFKKDSWKQAKATQVRRKDLVRFKSGETISFDGKLQSGNAMVNCHLLSGESTALSLCKGDSIFAGSVAASQLEMLVEEALGGRKIDAWAESALVSNSRSQTQSKILIQFESILTAAALTGALAIGLMHWLRGDTSSKIIEAFFIGILLFCPCLFASIIPLIKQMSKLSLQKIGILLFRAECLADLNDVSRVYLDKTGTLEAVESEIVAYDPEKKEFLSLLLQELSQKTSHPIMRSLTLTYDGINTLDLLTDIHEFSGLGVRATIGSQDTLWVGRPSFILSETSLSPKEETSLYPLVAINKQIVGQIITKTLFDEQAKKFIDGLLCLSKSLKIDILSGDPSPQAGRHLVAINPERITYRGNLSPEEKEEAILSNSFYIGDGLNDTLALAKANVSCRVGYRVLGFAPVDLQLQTPDLLMILSLFKYAKKYRTIRLQTIMLGFSYNAIAFSLAMAGKFSPLGAALAMLTSFALLLMSSLRLLKSPRSLTLNI